MDLVALGVLTVGALLVRVASIAEPLGIDQSLWASAVRGMSRGQLLYRDVWEQRPPGIYWVYLAGFHLFGWSASTVVWLDIVAAAVTTLLLWAIARRLNGPLAGLTAAALYAVLTMPAWLFRYGGFLERSVCETFIAVCVAASAWCAVRVHKPWLARRCVRHRPLLRRGGGPQTQRGALSDRAAALDRALQAARRR